MSRSRRLLIARCTLLAAVGCLCFSASARAQPAPEPAPQLEAPVLREFTAADYPGEARAAGLEADVVLRLSIDASGHVTAAEIVTAAGHGFDEAAVAAALKFVFTPAHRGEVALASRILYRYEFRAPSADAGPDGPSGLVAAPTELPPSTATTPETPTLPAPNSGTPVPIGPPPSVATATASTPPAAAATSSPAPSAPPAPTPSAASAPDATASDGTSLEIQVQGVSSADRLRRSAEAVTVVDTHSARRRSADLGDVLVAIPGVNVRRDGGLGSNTRFSLNGFSGDQVRLFLDGLPLELSGYPFGIANVPVNLVDRIEVYSGVVPIRFGADALGGAVNLVTRRPELGTHGSASYQLGSFDTHRFTLDAQQLAGSESGGGFYTHLSGLVDYAKNDYPVIAAVSDDEGRPGTARVYRFHDAYTAYSGSLELGVLDQPWAERLLLRGFVTRYDKQYQSNLIMTVPYGGLDYRETSPGGTLQYKHTLAPGVHIDAVAGYTYGRGNTRDYATCNYDWFGRCTSDRPSSEQRDQWYSDHSSFARLHLTWHVAPEHSLRLALAPNYNARSGEDRLFHGRGPDPLTAKRAMWSVVNGLEYQADLFDHYLENIAFVKQYIQALDGERLITGTAFQRRERDTWRYGIGDSLRVRLLDWLWLKGSYEFATRLPSPEEVFGDNVLVGANLDLLPEVSHNANAGIMVDARSQRAGAVRAQVNGFLRDADQLIMLLGGAKTQTYQNVYSARSTGVEASAGYTAPRDYAALDASFTYQDFRNTSHSGAFAAYTHDRIPSQPYLFANASARLQLPDLIVPRDQFVLFWTLRYVHSYYRGWESLGLKETKDVIPAQFVQSAGLGYVIHQQRTTLTWSLEVQNLTDERVYDYFGAQRPGRAFYAKVTGEL